MTSILCMALLSLPAIFHVLLWETDLQRDQKADFVFNLHLKWFKMELFFTWHCLLRGQSGCWKDWLCKKEISWAFQRAPVCKPENLGGCVWKRKIQNSVFSYPACVMTPRPSGGSLQPYTDHGLGDICKMGQYDDPSLIPGTHGGRRELSCPLTSDHEHVCNLMCMCVHPSYACTIMINPTQTCCPTRAGQGHSQSQHPQTA